MATDYSSVLKSVQALGLLKRRRASYVAKIAVLLIALAGCWVAFAFLGDHWAQLGIAAGLGVVFTQVLFLSHDAAHRQIFESNKANEWTALLLGTGLGGVSLAWWNTKHNRHTSPPTRSARTRTSTLRSSTSSPRRRRRGPGWGVRCTSARVGGSFRCWSSRR